MRKIHCQSFHSLNLIFVFYLHLLLINIIFFQGSRGLDGSPGKPGERGPKVGIFAFRDGK